MSGWLQLLIVYAVVAACTVYSCGLLLPRAVKAGAAAALAGLLGDAPQLARLRTALQAYAGRRTAAGACGGCANCSTPTGASPPRKDAAQPVHFHSRSGR
jgi:hypothetical protein